MRGVHITRFAALDGNGRPSKTLLPIRQVLRLEYLTEQQALGANKIVVESHYAGVQYPDFLQGETISSIFLDVTCESNV